MNEHELCCGTVANKARLCAEVEQRDLLIAAQQRRIDELVQAIDIKNKRHSLLECAQNEAISYAMCNLDFDFYRCWSEGDWKSIRDEWPDFDIFSESQIFLMKESGFNADELGGSDNAPNP